MNRSLWLTLALVVACTKDEGETDLETDVEGDTDTDTDSDTDTDTEPAATYADVQAITSAACLDCHGESLAGMMSLSGDWYANIVNVPAASFMSMDRIEPGDPDKSYLLLKLRGTHTAAGGGGGSMPPTGALSADKLETIESWINAGAVK